MNDRYERSDQTLGWCSELDRPFPRNPRYPYQTAFSGPLNPVIVENHKHEPKIPTLGTKTDIHQGMLIIWELKNQMILM